MNRERSSTWLASLGCLWLLLGGGWGYALYREQIGVAKLLTFGLGMLVAGLFFGRAIQRFRDRKLLKQETTPPDIRP